MSIVLETKRLVLKPIALSHFDDLVALRSDPEVMKYIGDGSTRSKEEVLDFIHCSLDYYARYGLDFFSVFAKKTGVFVGQAGLFHLGFDVKQPDIELAYRLHKKYWNKGYATEFARALIQWGFKHLALPKIIAMVHPDNERSRRVMEKSGMSYHGMMDFRGSQVPCYEIYNNQIDLNEIKLIPASLDEYPIIQNMTSYYAYDVSEYMGWAQEKNGTQNIGVDYIKYWQEDNTFPFIIKYQDELVGFVIIDKKVSNPANDFNMAQFFILRQFKGKGIGRHIAYQCFNQFFGKWEVFVMPGNEGAYRFWRKIINDYTQHQFSEFTRAIDQYDRNIFEFSSREISRRKP
ncbi:TPA: GNAT family N-acetyltransferase [Legionella pneumophila]|nr:GNAT family N-acetyltransferase [Legionella pneumophila]HAU0297543.1 GNAT family N-acetyltransferase [Legionella pneumophila]